LFFLVIFGLTSRVREIAVPRGLGVCFSLLHVFWALCIEWYWYHNRLYSIIRQTHRLKQAPRKTHRTKVGPCVCARIWHMPKSYPRGTQQLAKNMPKSMPKTCPTHSQTYLLACISAYQMSIPKSYRKATKTFPKACRKWIIACITSI